MLLVGTAALATFINAGGRGGILTAGITLYRYPVMVAGAVLVALLALLIEWVGGARTDRQTEGDLMSARTLRRRLRAAVAVGATARPRT